MLTIQDHWPSLFEPERIGALEARLPEFFRSARWFGRKTRTIASAHVVDRVPFETAEGLFVMSFVQLTYGEGATDVYVVPVTAAFGEQADRIEHGHPEAVILPLTENKAEGARKGLLIDALWDEGAACRLLNAMRENRTVPGIAGRIQASSTDAMRRHSIDPQMDRPAVMKGEQSNTSVRFGHRAMLKIYRHPEQGVNPDLELGRALTGQGYRHTPSVLGALEYLRPSKPAMTIGIAHQYIDNQGDAWSYLVERLERRWGSLGGGLDKDGSTTMVTEDLLGPEASQITLLGRRTAELHRSLSHCTEDPAFRPEPAGPEYWRYLHDRLRQQCEASLELLEARKDRLSPLDKEQADQIIKSTDGLSQHIHAVQHGFDPAVRIRCHGDFHLGQVLVTGHDFMIIDFEGEPARSLAERRAKHVPLLDVAGMMRSFHYASHVAVRRHRTDCRDEREKHDWEAWTARWYQAAKSAFLGGYAQAAQGASFWPQSAHQRASLLDLFLLDKALYELSYELNNRPDWAGIPLRGILDSIEASVTMPPQRDA